MSKIKQSTEIATNRYKAKPILPKKKSLSNHDYLKLHLFQMRVGYMVAIQKLFGWIYILHNIY